MALKLTADKFGMTFSDSYHKITTLTYQSNDMETFDETEGNTWVKRTHAHFEVYVYASKDTRDDHAEPVYRSHFSFEPSIDSESPNIITQAYDYLKTQDGYKEAVDC
jgi:hypothetical protein